MKKRPKPDGKTWNYLILTSAFAAVAMICWVTLIRKPAVEPAASAAAQQKEEATSQNVIPPFYANVDAARPFPKLIPAEYYHRYPLVERAYQDAAEIPGVVAQQPCYCYCDRAGHQSLLDCYASNHAAG